MIDGWEVSASTAEEARDAENGPGVGGLLGLVLTSAVLFGCMAAFLRVGTLAGFSAHEGDALAYVGSAIGGGPWRVAITITVLASLAAALQATLIYLTRSFFAMGRDGVLPLALGALDVRGQPTRAVVLLTGIGIAGTLASGFSPDIRSAFDFILEGTSAFIGALFVISAAAAVRIFAHEPGERWAGVILPAIGTLSLTTFIAVAALAGVPLALWRARAWVPAG
jgi:amino acid transporter